MAWINIETTRPYSVVVILLILAIFISGVALIYVINQSRSLYSYYHHLQSTSQKHQDEHARLLLQSTSETTIYKVLLPSLNSLNMYVPKVEQRLFLP